MFPVKKGFTIKLEANARENESVEVDDIHLLGYLNKHYFKCETAVATQRLDGF